MSRKIILILLIFYLLNGVFGEKNKIRFHTKDEDDTFIPTNEWKVVRKGQAIPKGLHVRINLQTGLTEAKLLDPTETTSKNSALLSVPDTNEENEVNHINEEDNRNSISRDELKHILKNIKADDETNLKRIKESFKNYEQLKQELGELNLSVKTDAEILTDLFKRLKDITSDANLDVDERNNKILIILQDFEYLVHQIDNANVFVDLNGFTEIIYKNLNNTNIKIKSESLNILGSAIQNNVKAQIHAFETGAIDKLLKILALDSDAQVKTRAIYALSNLLRHFPVAQNNFVKNGGLNVFISNFVKSNDMKLHMKIITLIYDLMIEDRDAHEYVDHPDYKEKMRQYESVDLKNKLNKLGWCKIFSAYFINNLSVEKNDHDFVGRCLHVMLLFTDTCRSIFKDENLKTALQELHRYYEFLSKQEELENSAETNTAEHDIYYKNLKILISKLLSNVHKENKIEL